MIPIIPLKRERGFRNGDCLQLKRKRSPFCSLFDILSVCFLSGHEVTYSQKICIFTLHSCSFFALPKIPRDFFAFLKNYDIKIQIMKIKHNEEIQAYHSS